jgi:hypothetical protein
VRGQCSDHVLQVSWGRVRSGLVPLEAPATRPHLSS